MKDGAQHVPGVGQDDVKKNKWMAVIGYIGILCIIPLANASASPFAKFHGKQGLVLFGTEVIVMFANQMVPSFWSLFSLINLGLFVLSVMGMLKAAEGQMWELPFFGQFAKKLNF